MLCPARDKGMGAEWKTSKATEIEHGVKLREAFITSDKYLPTLCNVLSDKEREKAIK